MLKKEILDNGIEITRNFDWDITKRNICIFMPNYHDRKFTELSLKKIRTITPKKDYVVIVGNDNVEESFDDFADDNVFYFNLKREEAGMRNGCFIRNFAIKRCQSELFFQKDGEVVILGDFISQCLASETPWRAGNIYVLKEDVTERFIASEDDEIVKGLEPTKKIDKIFPETAEEAKSLIHEARGNLNLSTYFHYAYCIRTKILQNINGYDEDYHYYGFEDSDMFCRLYAMGHKIVPDYSCSAIHLFHPRESINMSLLNRMSDIFKEKDVNESKRNPDVWGEGK